MSIQYIVKHNVAHCKRQQSGMKTNTKTIEPVLKSKHREVINMQLDDRGNKFIKELISNPSINAKDLEKKYSLTRRQIDYSFKKINDWLKTQNLPLIERTRQGIFIIDPIIFQTLSDNTVYETVLSKIFTENERVNLIILMLLSNNEELSIIHFTSELDVSKNTVLSDLKKAQSVAKQYSLMIRYSRREGYLIEGKEFHARRILMNTTNKVIEMNNGKELIKKLSSISEEEIDEFRKRLEQAENSLNLKFTDEKIDSMPYVLSLILKRIRMGKIVSYSTINYRELTGTKESKATEEILHNFNDIPMEERLFVTLHLLTTNVYWSELTNGDIIPDLIQALEQMLFIFERSACIVIQEKEQLLNKLVLQIQ